MKLALGIAIALVCSSQAPAPANDVKRGAQYNAERQAAVEAGRTDPASYRDSLAKVHADFPENSRIVRNLALVEAGLGHNDAALEMLRLYASMGGALDLKLDVWAPVRELAAQVPGLARNQEPVTKASRVFALQDPGLLVEDVAYDPAGKRFFLSSVHQRKIVTCDLAGNCKDFVVSSAAVPLGGVFALRVDAKHGVLWATTCGVDAASGFKPEEDGQSSLLQFNLKSGKLQKRLQAGDGKKHSMGDMVLSAAGDVYVSDGLSGDVFTVTKKGALETLVPDGVFISPQTPALSADGKLLYVPDYAVGIAVIRLSDRHIEWLKTSVPVALDGIDGLYCAGGRLIAVQNGSQPVRIAEFYLDAQGVLNQVTVLEANWGGLGEPTHAVLVGDEFYFIVNSGWDRMADGGAFAAGTPAELWKR